MSYECVYFAIVTIAATSTQTKAHKWHFFCSLLLLLFNAARCWLVWILHLSLLLLAAINFHSIIKIDYFFSLSALWASQRRRQPQKNECFKCQHIKINIIVSSACVFVRCIVFANAFNIYIWKVAGVAERAACVRKYNTSVFLDVDRQRCTFNNTHSACVCLNMNDVAWRVMEWMCGVRMHAYMHGWCQ